MSIQIGFSLLQAQLSMQHYSVVDVISKSCLVLACVIPFYSWMLHFLIVHFVVEEIRTWLSSFQVRVAVFVRIMISCCSKSFITRSCY